MRPILAAAPEKRGLPEDVGRLYANGKLERAELVLAESGARTDLSRAETYQFIHKALNRGLIRAVAHVHSDRNHQPRAWDIDSPNRELLWLRQERIRGRFCTCVPTGAATPGGSSR